ncbi:fungal-specific transcription factor domain-containing protein [Lophiotrema nucula]|uniref:Fungal-specific transcription factor domain-containing protein n=1 Tax=Lophiotrema nucula TaxID=690887 RepID=A0A6A5ZJQ5_9PLEO|nr:fungal-specific transcription factor domain-containing protein [Lophiotrema nucula]
MATEGPAKRSCGTCRERRISCDRTLPVCLQCTRTKRKCKGYDLRLFWPRENDRKRAVVARPPLCGKNHHSAGVYMINVHSWDIEMYHRLNGSLPDNKSQPILWIPMPFNSMSMDNRDKDLFQYFRYVASQALTVFGHEPTNLGNLLIRISLSSDSSSATAVRKAMLALSSLHRYGVQSQAIELKITSLKALASASKDNLGAVELVQHVAAGMLLCSFEIHQSSCTSSQWTFFISGVKEVIHTLCAPSAELQHNRYLAPLTDWVYYHDVLARFMMRHWRGETTAVPLNPSSWNDETCTQMPPAGTYFLQRRIPYLCPTSSMAILHLLSEVCESLIPGPYDSMFDQELEDYKNFLQVLDWRVRSIQVSSPVTELYQLAILVYINRVTNDLLSQSSQIEHHIDRAYSLFSNMPSCERQFPVFIIGCEARTDVQRTIILNLMSRTEKQVSSRSLNHARLLLPAIWVQDDLADGNIGYWEKLTSIISCCSIMPSLV